MSKNISVKINFMIRKILVKNTKKKSCVKKLPKIAFKNFSVKNGVKNNSAKKI